MDLVSAVFGEKSRLGSFLDHLGVIKDPRDPRRVAHPLGEVLLLVVCGTLADCDDYDHIAEWGESQIAFLRRFLPYHFGVPGGRELTLIMNQINPALFSEAFTGWVCPSPPRSFVFNRMPNFATARASKRAISSRPRTSALKRPSTPCAATGASRTDCTGCSTSPSP